MKASAILASSISGMLFLLIVMGAALFLPFGTLTYPLAWRYLAVFFGSTFLLTLYLFAFDKHLLKSRLAAGPIAEQTGIQKLIQSLAALAFLGIYILSAFDHRYRWSVVPLSLSSLADILCLLAFVFLFFVFKQNRFLSATIEVQEEQQVISTGLYAFVRHPMYTGAIALMFFTPIALGSFWGLIPSTILALVIGYRAVEEERTLTANLMGYKEYCERVRYRLLPFVY